MTDLDGHKRERGLRKRPDLTIASQRRGRQRVFVVKDPIAMEYHQLGVEEHFILSLLDGQSEALDLKRAFEARFAPRKIALPEIQSLLGLFHRKGLLLSSADGQGGKLLERRDHKRTLKFWSTAGNLLALRFRGVDPERFLARAYPYVRWIFSPPCLAACLLLALAALAFALSRFNELQTKLPEAPAYLTPQNLVLLAICVGVVKVFHELGHAFACKHFGGECHEIGFMLLVFTPALYCDVSDSWLLESKWRRAAIAAAGILVELFIASTCFFLWWFSEPGILNSLCLNMMIVCSVGTVLINGNPLLRYDGYFLLSDLLDVPNLWQASRESLTAIVRQLCLGATLPADEPVTGRSLAFAGYAAASVLYRVLVVITILTGIHWMLRPLGLGLLATLITIIVLAVLIVPPLLRVYHFLENPSSRRRMRRGRVMWTVLVVMAILLLVLFLPLPYRVAAPVVLEPRGAQRIYAPSDGALQWTVDEGANVNPGDQLVRMRSDELELELARLDGERRRQRLRLDNLLAMRSKDPLANASIPSAQEANSDLTRRVAFLRERIGKLTLVATMTGSVFSAPAKPHVAPQHDLAEWSGQLLDRRNRGCYVRRGELLCLVAQPSLYDAVLYVEQGEIEFLEEGQSVRIDLDRLGLVFGRLESLGRADVETIPPQLRQTLPIDIGPDGAPRPRETLYQARVAITDAPPHLINGVSGRAKVLTPPQSLARRWLRALQRTFAFRFD